MVIMKKQLRKLIILTIILLLMLTLTVKNTVAYRSSAEYYVEYYVGANAEKSVTINLPLPPTLYWQKLVKVINESLISDNATVIVREDRLEITFSGNLRYYAIVDINVSSIYDEGNVYTLLNKPLGLYIERNFNLTNEEYYEFTKPTYWWNYTSKEFNVFLDEFLQEYNYTEKNILKDSLYNVLINLRDYISNKLTYEPMSGGRQGVLKALNNGVGDCSEYSDIFITFSRALGIPTLRCIGFVIREWNSEKAEFEVIGHAWPIVYVPSIGWIPFETTVGPGYLNVKPGEISLKYICIVIDKGFKSIENMDLSSTIIYDPMEIWIPGSYSTLTINGLNLKLQFSFKPKPIFEVKNRLSIVLESNPQLLLILYVMSITIYVLIVLRNYLNYLWRS